MTISVLTTVITGLACANAEGEDESSNNSVIISSEVSLLVTAGLLVFSNDM